MEDWEHSKYSHIVMRDLEITREVIVKPKG